MNSAPLNPHKCNFFIPSILWLQIKEAAARRRQEDVDFEEKRMNMRIPEYFPSDRDPEQFDAAPIDNGPKQNTPQHYEHDMRGGGGGNDRSFNNDYNNHYDKRGGRQPQAENKMYNKVITMIMIIN